MSIKLFYSIYSYASKLGCDRPRKNLLEEIKNKIRKIDIFSAIYINIKVVTTNSKIGLQRSLQNLMLDSSKKKKSQIGQEFSSENDFEPRFSISRHCATHRNVAYVLNETMAAGRTMFKCKAYNELGNKKLPEVKAKIFQNKMNTRIFPCKQGKQGGIKGLE